MLPLVTHVKGLNILLPFLLRLQFWTDAVKSIESGSAKVPNHPVLQQINRHRALVDCQVGHQQLNFTFGKPAETNSKKVIYYLVAKILLFYSFY